MKRYIKSDSSINHKNDAESLPRRPKLYESWVAEFLNAQGFDKDKFSYAISGFYSVINNAPTVVVTFEFPITYDEYKMLDSAFEIEISGAHTSPIKWGQYYDEPFYSEVVFKFPESFQI